MTQPTAVVPNDSRYQNFLSPDLAVQFFDDNNNPINLTGINVATAFTFILVDLDQTISITGTGDWTIINAVQGQALYSFGLDDLSVVAAFAEYVTVQLPGEATPRAFPWNLLTVLAWEGAGIVTTNVNVTQITATSQPLPSNAAQETGGNLAAMLAKLTSILTALQGILSTTIQANSAVVATNNPLPVTAGQSGGALTPNSSNPGSTTANTDTPLSYTGNATAQRILLTYEGTASFRWELDQAATANSPLFNSGSPPIALAQPHQKLHIYATTSITIGAGGIIWRGFN